MRCCGIIHRTAIKNDSSVILSAGCELPAISVKQVPEQPENYDGEYDCEHEFSECYGLRLHFASALWASERRR
jgi:hypothetical protein